MINDKMRVAFEVWFSGQSHALPARARHDAWLAWQAATAVCTDLLQAKDMEIHELKFCIDGEAPLNEIIGERHAEIARLRAALAPAKPCNIDIPPTPHC